VCTGGHPAIPRVVASDHLQHLEYLAIAMELPGKSLEDVTLDGSAAAKIAVHLVTTLLLQRMLCCII